MQEKLNPVLQFINDNPWLNVLFIALTLLSIFLSFYFYYKSKKSKKPTYCLRTINLVKEKINKIETVDILYEGNKIDNLSISKFAIWNSGKETISNSDVAQNDKFRIEISSEFKILEFDLIHEQNSANGFKLLSINENILEIQFDYFDYNEGIVIQIYHNSTDDDSLLLKGSLKGTKKIFRSDNSLKILPDIFYKTISESLNRRKLMKRILSFMSFVLPIVFILLLFVIPENAEKTERSLLSKILIASTMCIPYWWIGYRTLKRRVPKGFDIFEDEF